jgi:hypothetical protein
MSVFHNNALIGAGAGTDEAPAAAEYVIPKSLRFNDGDSAQLKRTLSADGNKRTWTFSAWFKRGTPGSYNTLFGSFFGQSSRYYLARFRNTDVLDIFSGNYTTGSSATQQLNFITNAVYRDPSAWYHIVIAQDTTQSTESNRFKIYINGVLLESSDFSTASYPGLNTEGFLNAANATHYIGQYGENQHYFDGQMADIQLVDGQQLLPTDFGETRSSDGVWVPKEFTGFGKNPNNGTTWSDNIVATASGFQSGYGADKMFDGNVSTYGQGNSGTNPSTLVFTPPTAITFTDKVEIWHVAGDSSITAGINSGTKAAITNGSWQTVASGGGTLTTLDISRSTSGGASLVGVRIDGHVLVDGAVDNSFHLNFSDSSAIEALGFDSAPTTPDPDPKKGMDVITYSGNGGAQNIGGALFEPGLIWLKRRNASAAHALFDSIRGVTKVLESSNTGAEKTNDPALASFNPDGFSLNTSSGQINASSATYVAWMWRAGGPAVANTDGTITSQVSANTDYGFSIVTFTGTGSGTQSVGHGLSSVPALVITKSRGTTGSWRVFTDIGGTYKIGNLNNTDAFVNASVSAPTSSVFNVDGNSNASTTHVAYCWSEVSGYSKFNSYTGDGSTQTITTGFKPKFVIIKSSDTTSNWHVLDSERGSYWLEANGSSAENSNSNLSISYLDNGFTVNGSNINNSGTDYIYLAWADRPGNHWDVNNIVTNEGLTTSKTQFDVVTYTGNGGTQKIGGPVFSASAASSITNASNIFDGSTSTGGYSSSTGTDLTLTTSSFTISTQLRVYNNFRSDGTYAICLNGTCVTVAGSGTDSTQYRWSTVDLSSFTLPLTVTSLGYSASQTSGNTIRAIEVDSSNLLDGNGPSLKFQPDFLWLKARSVSYSHQLYDSIRGVQKAIVSNTTAAEATYSGGLTAFNSDGFTLGNDGGINNNNDTFVAYCWKAGGTAVSNTDGSVTSSVSANADYGFSIVTYSATGSDLTVGHGLGKKPALIILKSRNVSGDWLVMHNSSEPNKFLKLNTNEAQADASNVFTSVTDSVFGTGNDSGINSSGQNKVAYCFANVPGYQRIGSYVGNGSSTGPVIVTGFKPRFILLRSTSGSRGWLIYDTERDTNSTNDNCLFPHTNGSESSDSSHNMEILDNGFQPKTSSVNRNASGETYIYLAIGDDEIGSDEDCLVDVPNAVTADADATDTTGGYQRGNYATLNPLDKSSGLTLSNGNLQLSTSSGNNNFEHARSTIGVTTGKWYCEFKTTNGRFSAGVATSNSDILDRAMGDVAGSFGIASDGSNVIKQGFPASSHSNLGSTYVFATGDICGIAFDADNGTLDFYNNGVLISGASYTGLSTSDTYHFVAGDSHNGSPQIAEGVINFGASRFKYPMPSGYAALNTTALPAATIPDGSAQFDTVLWSGNETQARAITGLNYSPDLVWLKRRNAGSTSHQLHDAVRGASTGTLYADLTNAEDSNYNLTSFDSGGFTLGTVPDLTSVNKSGGTYVAWAWNAGANSNKTYTVKVVSDSGNKYRFDDFGTSAVTLDLAEGSTYVFDQSDSSNSGHPLRFSTTSDGTHNSGTEYTTGVTTTGTPGSAGAKTTIVVGSGVATLYYYCTNHSGMGGQANTNSTAGSSNFDGSVQSTVKANPEAGFSIVSYSATGSDLTVGHGLNTKPSFIILKSRNVTGDWLTMASALGETDFMKLNKTNANSQNAANVFLSTTNATFETGDDAGINSSGQNKIAYCFAAVAGYSAMGSFETNGNADNVFVYTGFRPRFIIWKRYDGTNSWGIVDTARGTTNVVGPQLLANTNDAEFTGTYVDILSNGFKMRNSGFGSGQDYIYYAVAENPFQANGGLAR